MCEDLEEELYKLLHQDPRVGKHCPHPVDVNINYGQQKG